MLKLISVDELQPGMYVHKLEVWWLKDSQVHNQMLLTDQDQIALIKSRGNQQVWIDTLRSRAVAEPQPEPAVVEEVPCSPFAHEVELARQLFHAGGPQVRAMFNEARMGNQLQYDQTLTLVDEIRGSIDRHPSALLSMARLKTHDDYTYLHSMAVCGLMISLARQMKLDDHQVRRAGLSGLLHDVGKAAIPLEILNKPDRLTDQEMTIMQQHPVVGAQMLMDAGAGADLIDVALHHHEKVDGSGYPHRLKGEKISLLARMAAICDVYDAVTSVRPYKEGWHPTEAVNRMVSWKGHFDRTLFQRFVRAIGIYPVGSLVRLASGRVALVVQAGEQSLLRPRVHVFYSMHGNHAIPPELLDLGDSFCTDSITGPETAPQWLNYNLEPVWALTQPHA